MTNNPDKILQLEQHGINVNGRIKMIPEKFESISQSPDSKQYLERDLYLTTKRDQMGHLL